jgi:hypothetical protein
MGRVETIKMVKRDKWELESETGSWHDSEIFKFYTNKEGRAYDNRNSLLDTINFVKTHETEVKEEEEQINVPVMPF